MNSKNFFRYIKKIIIWILCALRLYGPFYRVYMYVRFNGKKIIQYFDRFIEEIERKSAMYEEETILFYGFMLTERKKVIFSIMEYLVNRNPKIKILVLQNALHLGKTEKHIQDTMIPSDVILFPELGKREIERGMLPTYSTDMDQLFRSKYYLQEAMKNISSKVPWASSTLLKTLVCEYYRAYCIMLERMNITTVIIWNKFHACHYILSELCRERKVRVIYAEFGSLPGTVVLDKDGQMGESWPATHPFEFMELPVTEEECVQAARIVATLRASGLNRNIQSRSTQNNYLYKYLDPNRPTILYAGQYDADSGMIPYTEHTKRFHSPCFASSEEGMLYVADIAKKYNWNFIFKPHPLMKSKIKPKQIPKNVIFIPDYNINDIIDLSNVVVTILSSTAYVSLIRDTATVMLGYNQISKKGCVYEAFCQEDIECALVAAVENGYTDKQKEAFVRHVAQMNKYYLYTDGQDRQGFSLGRPICDAVRFIEREIEKNHNKLVKKERSCIICNSLQAFLTAVQIKSIYENWYPELLMIDVEFLKSLLNLETCKKFFSAIKWITTLNKEMEFVPNDKTLEEYTDIYFPATENVYLIQLAQKIFSKVLKIHLYDDGSGAKKMIEIEKYIRNFINKERAEKNFTCVELITYNVKNAKKSPYYSWRQISNNWMSNIAGNWFNQNCKNNLISVIDIALKANLPMTLLLQIAQYMNHIEEISDNSDCKNVLDFNII